MNQVKKVISIDHGNRHIKTLNHVFPASFIESGHLPTFGGDALSCDGKEYTLADQRMPQKTDKTKDDSYFILTLFAIGKELVGADTVPDALPMGCIDVTLLVGLPPIHCKEMGLRFTRYFKERSGFITFKINQHQCTIRIVDVHVFPQAYAAVIASRQGFMDTSVVNLVDVGGYTVDLLQLIGLRPDMSICTSLYAGVNSLFQKINEQVRAKGANNIPDATIESILKNDVNALLNCSQERLNLVRSSAEQFVKELLLNISQTGLDLVENRTVFVGGGSILLKEYIEKTGAVAKPFFVDDIRANAKGYQLLYENRSVVQPQSS